MTKDQATVFVRFIRENRGKSHLAKIICDALFSKWQNDPKGLQHEVMIWNVDDVLQRLKDVLIRRGYITLIPHNHKELADDWADVVRLLDVING